MDTATEIAIASSAAKAGIKATATTKATMSTATGLPAT